VSLAQAFGRFRFHPPPGFALIPAASCPDACLVLAGSVPSRPGKPLFGEGPADLRPSAFAPQLACLLVPAGGLSPLDWARAEAAGLAGLPGFKVRFLAADQAAGRLAARAQFSSFAQFRLERLLLVLDLGAELAVASLTLPRSRDAAGWGWLRAFVEQADFVPAAGPRPSA
jgi:hypothetical protein